jgi:hypothetical protein
MPGPDQPPALVGPALYVVLADLASGIEGIEFEVEVMLGGFARIVLASLAVLRTNRIIGAIARVSNSPTRSTMLLNPLGAPWCPAVEV